MLAAGLSRFVCSISDSILGPLLPILDMLPREVGVPPMEVGRLVKLVSDSGELCFSFLLRRAALLGRTGGVVTIMARSASLRERERDRK